ncbi:MAG: DedA family protein, partial [Pseudohongiella sp.]|nr:DedA family protein [Pseudohongiella sp.]
MIIIEPFTTDWLTDNQQYAAPAIFILAFAEACIGIGLFVSGIVLFSVATLLYSTGVLSLVEISLLAFPGALLGDQAGFFVGRHFGPGIHKTRIGQRYAMQFQRAEKMISRH